MAVGDPVETLADNLGRIKHWNLSHGVDSYPYTPISAFGQSRHWHYVHVTWIVVIEAIGDSFTSFEHGGEWYCSFTVFERRPEKRSGNIWLNERPFKKLIKKLKSGKNFQKWFKEGKSWSHRWDRWRRRRRTWKMNVALFFLGFWPGMCMRVVCIKRKLSV